ncbi:hypothetical protein E3P99_00769 [Wallemia hederae]|uniref:Protein SQS1 n=1 Tax=Wallemia hederae TaxID=1540922 RepID=A0A4T0FVJ7_9BASI|nr:hypothetical protein E3P99_00769 [Wallemia hederae]
MPKKTFRGNNKGGKGDRDGFGGGSGRGRGGFRGGGRGRGTPRTGRGGLQYQAGSMNTMGFDYSQIDAGSELPRYSNVDTHKTAPTAPKKDRINIKQQMPYFVNDSKGKSKSGHKGLGYVRKSPQEEAALAERKMSKGKARGASSNPNANPLLQPIAFVKGSSSWDKDMDLSKIKMAAETKDAEDIFVQIPTEQSVDQTVDTSAAENNDDDDDDDGEDEIDVSNLLQDTSIVASSVAEDTSTAGEDDDDEDDDQEKVTQHVHIDASMPSISQLNIEESADSSVSFIDTSVADTSIHTVTEPNTTRNDNDILDEEEIEDQMVDNDDLFIVDSQPAAIPDSLKPKDAAAIVVNEPDADVDADDIEIQPNPHHSFSRSDIVQVDDIVSTDKKNSKMFTAMQNDNLFKNVHQLGNMFASGNKPTFEDFAFSPKFNQKKNKKDKKKKNKAGNGGERVDDEPLEPRVGDSDLEWGSDGPPPPKHSNKHSKQKQPKKPTFEDELVADWIENTQNNDDSDSESGGEKAAGPLGADDGALRSFVNSMSKNQDSITDLQIDKRFRKEAREEAELDRDSEDSEDSDDSDAIAESVNSSEFERAEDFKFNFSDAESIDIEDDGIYLDSSLSSEEAYELGRARAKAAKTDGVVLERNRKGKKGENNNNKKDKGKKRAEDFLDDYDELMDFDDFEGKHNKWDEEEQFLDELAAIIENKKHNLQKAKSSSRQGSRQGKYSYDDYGDVYGDDDEDSEEDFALDPRDLIFPTSSKKKKAQVPPQLQRMWDQDRARKAEKKQAREQIRMAEALSPYTKTKGKKAKKMQAKAIRAAAELSDDDILPDYYNTETINYEIQSFVDVPQRKMMKLPPMDNKSRKQIHMLADAYNLKSKSVGKGVGRHIMLLKTARSGHNVDYAVVNKAAKACNDGGIGNFYKTLHLARKAASSGKKGASGPKPVMTKHREGTIVGHEAQPIGQESVGYKMLAMMGWNHGQKMGQSGEGLEAPVAAVIKNSRLGLGAL